MRQPPVSRRTDPESSHAAEREINKKGRATQQNEILGLVRLFPGRTSLELSKMACCQYDRYQVARRLSDLHEQGRVLQGFVRTCRVGGRMAVEWYSPEDWARTANDV